MVQLRKAHFWVEWLAPDKPERIDVQYNPTELSFEKSVQLAEIAIPGLDAPLQQFVRGQAEKLTLELFFDTTNDGMGNSAKSVTSETDKIYQLVKIQPRHHAPPVCTFIWGDAFPGSSVGAGPDSGGATGLLAPLTNAVNAVVDASGAAAAEASAAQGSGAAPMGNQRRNGFPCVVESVRQKLTLFSPTGVPLRAILSVTLREYRSLSDQLARLNLSSPDRTHTHVVTQGQTLSAIAAHHYGKSASWRAIADENQIEDPRRLRPGTPLTVPSLRS